MKKISFPLYIFVFSSVSLAIAASAGSPDCTSNNSPQDNGKQSGSKKDKVSLNIGAVSSQIVKDYLGNDKQDSSWELVKKIYLQVPDSHKGVPRISLVDFSGKDLSISEKDSSMEYYAYLKISYVGTLLYHRPLVTCMPKDRGEVLQDAMQYVAPLSDFFAVKDKSCMQGILTVVPPHPGPNHQTVEELKKQFPVRSLQKLTDETASVFHCPQFLITCARVKDKCITCRSRSSYFPKDEKHALSLKTRALLAQFKQVRREDRCAVATEECPRSNSMPCKNVVRIFKRSDSTSQTYQGVDLAFQEILNSSQEALTPVRESNNLHIQQILSAKRGFHKTLKKAAETIPLYQKIIDRSKK